MISRAPRGNILLTLFIAVVAFGSGPNRAEAQFGFGGGFGGWGGWGGFRSVPNPKVL